MTNHIFPFNSSLKWKYIELNINFHEDEGHIEHSMKWRLVCNPNPTSLRSILSRTKGEKIESGTRDNAFINSSLRTNLMEEKRSLEIALPCPAISNGWENQLGELLMSLCKHFWCWDCNQLVLALFIYEGMAYWPLCSWEFIWNGMQVSKILRSMTVVISC